MKALDNTATAELPLLLNRDTTLERFYPLIPLRESLVERLLELGLRDKYLILARMEEDEGALARELGLEPGMLRLFKTFLHLHDFEDRRLSEVSAFCPQLVSALAGRGITRSGQYLMLCAARWPGDGTRSLSVDGEQWEHLFNLCDLMRLPGVKAVRANLYYCCGYRSLKHFSLQTWDGMRAEIAARLPSLGLTCTVPLRKELSTQIAVAEVLPHISWNLDRKRDNL